MDRGLNVLQLKVLSQASGQCLSSMAAAFRRGRPNGFRDVEKKIGQCEVFASSSVQPPVAASRSEEAMEAAPVAQRSIEPGTWPSLRLLVGHASRRT